MAKPKPPGGWRPGPKGLASVVIDPMGKINAKLNTHDHGVLGKALRDALKSLPASGWPGAKVHTDRLHEATTFIADAKRILPGHLPALTKAPRGPRMAQPVPTPSATDG